MAGYLIRYRSAGMLREFASLAEAERASHITTALALRWARQPVGVEPAH